MKVVIRYRLAIALLGFSLALFSSCNFGEDERCSMCQRPLHAETLFRVVGEHGKTTSFCCTRCSLHGADPRSPGNRVEVADYDTHQLIPLDQAIFVEDSDVQFCGLKEDAQRDRSGGTYQRDWDRCLPSALAFAETSRAVAFSSVHGGHVRTYDELRAGAPTDNPMPHH